MKRFVLFKSCLFLSAEKNFRAMSSTLGFWEYFFRFLSREQWDKGLGEPADIIVSVYGGESKCFDEKCIFAWLDALSISLLRSV